MNIRFPKPLAHGDLIAITAPSSGVPAPLYPRLDRAIDALLKRGYRVVEGECLRQQYKSASAAPEQRASELMRFLTEPGIAAVMPPWGGELAMELLPLLDFRALADVPAKWFSGFSDLSTLHLPLTTIAGWATLHGPNLMQLGGADTDAVTAAIWDVFTVQPDTPFSQGASQRHQSKGVDQPAGAGVVPLFDEETTWKGLDHSKSDLELSGRLIGGCLDTISRLAGTSFGNVPCFVQSSLAEGTLLYLENAEMKPCELVRSLLSLRLSGWFEGLSGVLIGRNAAPDSVESDELSYIDALRSVLGDIQCPVMYDMDIGHVPPQLSLVNGALAQVKLRDGCGTVVQRLA
ncbi:Microcin C7 self-immunity protein MccF [Paraburkholderia nemoris]|uniref:S66 family peptidase n=1 Tax=Paraburkholderia nemoris TaxID=2793076 RepID=UPI0019129C1A|nr:S66 peptidase family protein [Paraburkholderia nemoris]MBK5147767.1 LD-carboxypeptidase [Burkholderia sp. R-69608]CAE6881800.1 Microcin C7 self-immunity protein MccF [Paraburkholderia nemoris]